MRYRRFLSFVCAFALITGLLPVQSIRSTAVYAAEIPEQNLESEISGESDPEEDPVMEVPDDQDEEPEIIHEPDEEDAIILHDGFGGEGQDGTAANPYIISNADDWSEFADKINAGEDGYSDKVYKLADDFDNHEEGVTVSVGTEENPFKGIFIGNGRTLKVNIKNNNVIGNAPFRYIDGAVIRDLTVTGEVTGSTHSAGLVGFSTGDEGNLIENCLVGDSVKNHNGSGNRHIGGVVGHALDSKLTIRKTICTSYLFNYGDYAGGLIGWCDEGADITIDTCVFDGSTTTNCLFHPIGTKSAGAIIDIVFRGAYYTYFSTRPASASNTITDGIHVTADIPSDGIYSGIRLHDRAYYITTGLTCVSTSYAYTGDTIGITPVLSLGDTVLEEGTDYTLTFSPETIRDIGEYTLTITGTGDFEGVITRRFVVVSPISLGTGPITDPVESNGRWSYVYYGDSSVRGGARYRVLDKDTTEFNSADDNAAGRRTMLLDCDAVLFTRAFDADSDVWSGSDLSQYLNGTGFLGNRSVFTDIESRAIVPSTKAEPAESDGTARCWSNGELWAKYAPLTGERVFLLDVGEVTRPTYGYPDNRSASYLRTKICAIPGRTDGYNLYRTRSPATYYQNTDIAYVINGQIQKDYNKYYDIAGVSPVFNLDLSQIRFTTLISGIPGEPEAEYKLSIIDEDLSVALGEESVNRTGKMIEVPYVMEGTHCDVDTQICLLLLDHAYTPGETVTDSEKYAFLSPLTVDDTFDGMKRYGTAEYILPDHFADGELGTDYHAYIFVKNDGGPYRTDYVSDVVEITYMKPPRITGLSSAVTLEYNYSEGPVLYVSAEADEGFALSYQWYETTGDNTSGRPVDGATGADYTIPPGLGHGTTGYYCVVTATRGSTSSRLISDVIPVTVVGDQIRIKWIGDQVYTGAPVKPVPVVTYHDIVLSDKDYTVSYSNNTKVADRNAVNAKTGASIAPTVTVRGKGNYAGTAVATFAITPYDLSSAHADDILLVYNGRGQKGKSKVTCMPGTKVLTLAENKDYTLKYFRKDMTAPEDQTKDTPCGNNGPADAGEYRVVVTGEGNYKGSTWFTERIVKSEYNITKASLSSIPAQDYDHGKAFVLEADQVENPAEQTRVIKKSGKTMQDYTFIVTTGGKKLIYGDDYTLTYVDNDKVGTATVTVTGTGDGITGYTGSKTTTFKINGIPFSSVKNRHAFVSAMEYDPNVHEYKQDDYDTGFYLQEGTGQTDLIKNTDYTVTYENNTGVGTATVTYTGMGRYTGSVRKTFKITGVAMSSVKLVTDLSGSTGSDGIAQYRHSYDPKLKGFVYTGRPFYVAGLPAPEDPGLLEDSQDYGIKLTYTDPGTKEVRTLVKGSDYSVSYLNNVLPGTATVIFTGKGLYSGEIKKTFAIKPYSLNEDQNIMEFIKDRVEVTLPDASYAYTKGGVKPAVTVSYRYGIKRTILTEGTDYTVTYKNNNEVTTAQTKNLPTLVVSGKGAFSGSAPVKEFKITAADLAEAADMMTTDVVEKPGTAGICKTVVTLTEKESGMKLSAKDVVPANQYLYFYTQDNTIVGYKKDAKTTETRERSAGDPVDPKDIIHAGTKIRVLVQGKDGYLGSSIEGTFYFVEADIAKAEFTAATRTYTGSRILLNPDPDNPETGDLTVKVKVNGQDRFLKYGTDYKILNETYTGNTQVGTARVTIQGISEHGYTGSKVVSFKITAKSMDYAVTYDDNYDGLIEALLIKKPDGDEDETWYREHYRLSGNTASTMTPYGGKLARCGYTVKKKTVVNGADKWVNVPAATITFTGWGMNADGSGQTFANGGLFKPYLLTRLVFGDKYTLHAVWE